MGTRIAPLVGMVPKLLAINCKVWTIVAIVNCCVHNVDTRSLSTNFQLCRQLILIPSCCQVGAETSRDDLEPATSMDGICKLLMAGQCLAIRYSA